MKSKIAITLLSTLVFLILLFPFDDLSDLVTAQIVKASGQTAFLQFEKLNLSLIPHLGLSMQKVDFESPQAPRLHTDELIISPSLSSLLYKKPYGHVIANGLFRGSADLQVSKGDRSETGTAREKIKIKAQKISLHEVQELAQLPVPLQGQLQIDSVIQADLTLKEQPEMDIELQVQQFEIPTASVPTPMGPLVLPEVKMGQIQLKGRLSGGNFLIEKGTLGQGNDDLQGNIKGSLGLTLENRGGMPVPRFESYTFDVELKVKKAFQERASALLFLLDSYKSPTSDGAIYKFKISGMNFYMPPSITALR